MNATANDTGNGAQAAPPSKSAGELVKFSDGRTAEFVGKRKMIKESLFPEGEMPVIRLDFRNGETRSFRVPDGLLLKFAAHGAEQKLGDETAGTDDVDDMVLEVDSLIERLERGEWTTRREGGGMSGTSVLLKALVEFNGGAKTLEELKTWLKSKTVLEKNALRASKQLKPIVQRIESEKEAKLAKVDTDQLLAGLGEPSPQPG